MDILEKINNVLNEAKVLAWDSISYKKAATSSTRKDFIAQLKESSDKAKAALKKLPGVKTVTVKVEDEGIRQGAPKGLVNATINVSFDESIKESKIVSILKKFGFTNKE